jgi:putative transposase
MFWAELPKTVQSQAKQDLWEIYRAPSKHKANQSMDRFVQSYQAKYPEAVECLGS